MPGFGSLTVPPAVYQGGSVTVWNAETPGAGATSQEVALAIIPGATGQSISAEIIFGGAPGAFEVDLMTSDTDALADLVMEKSVTVVNTGNVARIEASPVVANFAALFIKTLTNNVSVTAKISLK